MKVFAISDLHLSTVANKPMDVFGSQWENYVEKIIIDWTEKVDDDDLVLLCGDFSWAMRLAEVLPDLDLIAKLKGKKLLLRGNHDYWWNGIGTVRQNLPPNFFALQNDCLRFENFLICGTRGWICPQDNNLSVDDNKIFLRETERLKLSLSEMQKMRQADDVVIGIMHFPPFNGRYESSMFTKLFLENNVNTVVYGHLHGKDCRSNLHLKKFGMDFFLTSCDQVDNKLVLIAKN